MVHHFGFVGLGFFFTNILEHQIARAFLCKHFNVEIVGWVCH